MAWLNSSWLRREKFTIEADQVDEDTGVYTLLLSQFTAYVFISAQADGDDFRVTLSDGTTECPCEIVGYSQTLLTGAIHFKITGSASVDVVGYLYYANSGATRPAITDTYGAENVWDSSWRAVYNFSGGSLLDSTTNDYDLTAVNSPTTSTGSAFGAGLTFNGSTQYVYHTGTPVTDWPVTLTAWFSAVNVTAGHTLGGMSNTANSNNVLYIRAAGNVASDPLQCAARGNGGSASSTATSNGFSATTWSFASGSRDDDTGTTTVILNGGTPGTESTTVIAPSWTTIAWGVQASSSLIGYLNGSLAFCAVHNVARSENFLQTMYNNITSGSFFAYDDQVELESGRIITDYRLFSSAVAGTAHDVSWTSISNAVGIGSNATASLADGEVADEILWTGANFADIPSDATLVDISVRFYRSNNTGSGRSVNDQGLYLRINGVNVGNDISSTNPWDALSMDYYTSEGLWGIGSLSQADLDAGSSGIALTVEGFTSGSNVTASMDYAQISVTYDPAEAPASNTGFFAFM